MKPMLPNTLVALIKATREDRNAFQSAFGSTKLLTMRFNFAVESKRGKKSKVDAEVRISASSTVAVIRIKLFGEMPKTAVPSLKRLAKDGDGEFLPSDSSVTFTIKKPAKRRS